MSPSIPPTTSTPSRPTTLPRPQTYDLLPPLQTLLQRLLLNPSDKDAMNPEDIGTAVSALKMRIQKARAELEGMPDMHRTVEEQREEIDELEGRIREQRRIIMGVVERMGNGV